MTIKNYTTKIGVNQTVAQIHQLLAKKGARVIMNEYDDSGIINSVSFKLSINGQPVSFKLPSRVQGVLTALERDSNVPRHKVNLKHATRVAWRIIKDWIDAQLAIVEAGCAEMAEVFLPYALNHNGDTVYEFFQEKGLELIAYKGE